jgi:hypothetical protein
MAENQNATNTDDSSRSEPQPPPLARERELLEQILNEVRKLAERRLDEPSRPAPSQDEPVSQTEEPKPLAAVELKVKEPPPAETPPAPQEAPQKSPRTRARRLRWSRK